MNNMKKKKEILKHLNEANYTIEAVRDIYTWIKKLYRLKNVTVTSIYGDEHRPLRTFEDFIRFVYDMPEKKQPQMVISFNPTQRHWLYDFMCAVHENDQKEETVSQRVCSEQNKLFNKKYMNKQNADEIRIGDWVKYIPEPGEEYTEVVEAIAHDAEDNKFLCLSNGEYVKPSYCIKYKVQGKERQELIDELNATI